MATTPGMMTMVVETLVMSESKMPIGRRWPLYEKDLS